jgi:hypothetical protein
VSGLHSLTPDDDSDDERTTVVDRSAPADDHEGTVVVDRRAPSAEEGNETVVVDRALDPDNETIVVDRPSISARADESDGTIVVGRRRANTSSKSAPASTGRRGRRRITLPPVEPGFGPAAVEAVGPGAISAYSPREIQPPPPSAPLVPLGPDATRAPAPSMPSVGKRSRSFGMIAVGGFALACVVSVVGLGVIVTSLLG